LRPQVPTLTAAEMPILSVEATLAAFASFALGLPWWLPLVGAGGGADLGGDGVPARATAGVLMTATATAARCCSWSGRAWTAR
jgi:hypothetical protein